MLTDRERSISEQLEIAQEFLDAYARLSPAKQTALANVARYWRSVKACLEARRGW